jgi:tRNA G10  N-methylase Trm11
MTRYLFILGRTPDLAFLELQTFFPVVTRLIPDVVACDTKFSVPASTILSRLGGTVKIAEKVGTVADVTPETLVPFFDTAHGRFSFGVSVYGGMQKISREVLENMKQLLESRGISVRFVESRDGAALSSVVVEKNQLQELVIVQTGDGYIVGKTVAVQPFDAWGKRDFGRPNADVKAGMLPPKVSRMVVNIADRQRDVGTMLAQKTLLDPFCGMGTILSEALVMGWNVVGSDVDADVVTRARANIRWLTESKIAAEGVTCRLNVADAVHVSDSVDHNTIDAIVTEPYMGPTEVASGKKGLTQLKNIVKGLEKLYIGCLRDWCAVLKPRGFIMMAMPMFEIEGKSYFVKKVIDKCEMLGYTIVTGPIEYGRPGATVKRLFYLFQKI